MSGRELLRNGRGRIRCYWWFDESDECSDDGWAVTTQYFLDSDGYVPLCYNHSDWPTREYVRQLQDHAKGLEDRR